MWGLQEVRAFLKNRPKNNKDNGKRFQRVDMTMILVILDESFTVPEISTERVEENNPVEHFSWWWFVRFVNTYLLLALVLEIEAVVAYLGEE